MFITLYIYNTNITTMYSIYIDIEILEFFVTKDLIYNAIIAI